MPKHGVHLSLRSATGVGVCGYEREHAWIKVCVWREGRPVFVSCESFDECLCVHMCAEHLWGPAVIVMILDCPGSASTEWEWEPEEDNICSPLLLSVLTI